MDAADLSRFLQAQESAHESAHESATAEISAGRKRTHWMWFIFPQLRGLGQSRMTHVYGIADLSEAKAYLAHPVLGSRLRQLVALVGASAKSPDQIFGQDACKYLSCLTLFALAEGSGGDFDRALKRQCPGQRCEATITRLENM